MFEIIENINFDEVLMQLGLYPQDSNSRPYNHVFPYQHTLGHLTPSIAHSEWVYETSYPGVINTRGQKGANDRSLQSSSQTKRRDFVVIQENNLIKHSQGKLKKCSKIQINHPVTEFQVRRLS